MSVVFSTNVAWGLKVNEESIDHDDPYEVVYKTAKSFGWKASEGGDLMNSENIAYVVHPPDAILGLMDTSDRTPEPDLGVYSVEDIYEPTKEEWELANEIAESLGIEPDIGHWILTRVS